MSNPIPRQEYIRSGTVRSLNVEEELLYQGVPVVPGGGGGGGQVDSVVAGTGISVDSTDPVNPIVSSTVVNTDQVAKVSANDTTAGFLNGKLVAGSGITFTEDNDGGNETLTIAASGGGGGGGSSDITYYTATLADAENTTSKINLISCTVPANTWADGDRLVIHLSGDITTNSSSASLTAGVEGTGFGPYTRSANLNVSSDPNRFDTTFTFKRNGSGIYYYVGAGGTWSESNYLNIGVASLLIGSFGGINSVSDDWQVFDASVDYTTDITVSITAQWGTAGAGIWVRPFWGTAYKEKGAAL